MCYQKLFPTLLAALVIAGTANAQNNDIVKWGDGDQGDHFNIVDSEGTIEILRGDGFNYKFYATDTAHMTGLGVINIITIATTVTGSFTILIDHETPGLRGAREWGVADLRHPNWPTDTCTIAGIDVVEVVLRYDPPGLPPPIENILCDAINGDIDIGTLAPIRPGDALARKLEAGAVVGSIFIESFRGDLNFASLTGNITTGAGTPERTPGDITIRSSYGGTITFNDPEGYVGRVHIVNGNFSGRIDFPTGEMFGAVEIDGDFIVPGRIVCGTNAYFERENGGDPPSVHVHGSLANPNSIPSDQPMITSGFQSPDGGLRGLIAIDGDLQNAVTAGPEILVWIIRDPFEDPPGEFTARGAIAVDYDGWDDGDDWEAGATVEEWIPPVVNPTVNVYDENTPGKSVYEITPCRGDANNDGQVTSADIYGLTLARLLPDIGYSETDISDCFVDNYSGLEGSILWHGDWDCSNDITCVDANLHRWFLVNYPECCIGACPAPRACRADFDRDGTVGLQDLSNLLSSFGACEGDPLYNPLYDLVIKDCDAIEDTRDVCDRVAANEDECIELADLAVMLSSYGLTCRCDGGGGGGFAGFGGGEGEDPAFVEWVRNATPEEILEWYQNWLDGLVGP